MAAIDKASQEQVLAFEQAKQKIIKAKLSRTPDENYYLEQILENLEQMTAFYSYGNGEIFVEHNLDWDREQRFLNGYEHIFMQEMKITLEIERRSDNKNNYGVGAFVTDLWFDCLDMYELIRVKKSFYWEYVYYKLFQIEPHYYILRKGLIEEDRENPLFNIATIDTEMGSPFVRIVKEEWLSDIGEIYSVLKEFFESLGFVV
ncbi:MAG: hypothetical protein EBE86_002250 [Hormoscilla sp. GUM202]|nr:hypothetical protein [Hormoscilla sp. GUM202]